jgi:hypothetical protein
MLKNNIFYRGDKKILSYILQIILFKNIYLSHAEFR